jgi:DNA-binding response OmpR family regulator
MPQKELDLEHEGDVNVRPRLKFLLENPDLDERVRYATGRVLSEIWENNPYSETYYERAILLLLEHPGKIVPTHKLAELFETDSDRSQAVRNLISRLNEKFSKYNAGPQHVSGYKLVAGESTK